MESANDSVPVEFTGTASSSRVYEYRFVPMIGWSLICYANLHNAPFFIINGKRYAFYNIDSLPEDERFAPVIL